MISYGRQFIDKQDEKSVIDALRSNWLTQGPRVLKFENKLKNYFGARYCVAVSNGTLALYLLAKALQWKKNDIIICSPISFLAASNSVIMSGATPHFVDIDSETGNINVSLLEKVIKNLKKNKKKVKAIVVTDYGGLPADWKALKKIGQLYKINLINDNCHAMGAKYYGDKKYALKYADFAIQSYHAVKNITTGEGGSVLTNNKKIINKVRMLATHGLKRGNFKFPWYYEMKELGYNARITDFQSALGSSQLSKLNKIVKKKVKISKIYKKNLEKIQCIEIPKIYKTKNSAFHLYPIKIKFDKLKINKLQFFKLMKKKRINLQVHYIPIYFHPYYQNKYKINKSKLSESRKFYDQIISLPIYYSITYKELNYVIKTLKNIIYKNIKE